MVYRCLGPIVLSQRQGIGWRMKTMRHIQWVPLITTSDTVIEVRVDYNRGTVSKLKPSKIVAKR